MRPPPLTPLAAAALHVPAPERALVVGCGDGEPVLLLAREFPAARVRGVDSSAELIGRAGGRTGLDPEGRIAFKRGKPGALPYPDSFFDLAVAVEARARPGEIARVLRPGGHLIVARERPLRFAAAFREGLLRRRLARAGIAIELAEPAGDGNFLVGRLAGGDPAAPAI